MRRSPNTAGANRLARRRIRRRTSRPDYDFGADWQSAALDPNLWRGPIERRFFLDTVNGTTYPLTGFDLTIPVGTLVVVGCHTSSQPGLATCADNSAQAGSANIYSQHAGISTANGTMTTFTSILTRSILATDTITCSQASQTAQRAASLLTFSFPGTIQFDRSIEQRMALPITALTSPLVIGPTIALHDPYCLAITIAGGRTGNIAEDSSPGWTNLHAAPNANSLASVTMSWNHTADASPLLDTMTWGAFNGFGDLMVMRGLTGVYGPTGKNHPGRRVWAGR